MTTQKLFFGLLSVVIFLTLMTITTSGSPKLFPQVTDNDPATPTKLEGNSKSDVKIMPISTNIIKNFILTKNHLVNVSQILAIVPNKDGNFYLYFINRENPIELNREIAEAIQKHFVIESQQTRTHLDKSDQDSLRDLLSPIDPSKPLNK